jgi:hypothetical protein
VKIIKLVGLVIGLAALFGCAAEAPSAAPPRGDCLSWGANTACPGASGFCGHGAASVDGALSIRDGANPATSVAIDHSHHPSWTVDVYGFQ